MINCDSRRLLLGCFALVALFLLATFTSDNASPLPSSAPPATQEGTSSARSPSLSSENKKEKLQNQNQIERRDSSSSSSSSASSSLATSGGVAWAELGRTGWARPTRQRGETSWGCPAVRDHLEGIYAVVKRNINFAAGPRFGMPWFFHEPHPVCGSILLRHQHGSLDTAPVLRISTKKFFSSSSSSSSSSSTPFFSLPSSNSFQEIFGQIDPKTEAIDVIVGNRYDDLVRVEDCGDQLGFSSVLITARLVSYNYIVSADVADVVVSGSSSSSSNFKTANRKISLLAPVPGLYVLEVKIVHANGTSDNPRVPRSLGVVGIRATIGGRKAFMYNSKCDFQRHVVGSPLLVRAHHPAAREADSSSSSSPPSSSMNLFLSATSKSTSKVSIPLCTRGDYTFGFWVRIANPKSCHSSLGLVNLFCAGDTEWVSDAAAYNTKYVWVPVSSSSSSSTSSSSSSVENSKQLQPACRYHYFSPPQGPARSCLRSGDSRAFLYLVGDSVIREYAKNCDLLSLRNAKLQCLFANIALEGQHFSNSYAESVAKTIVTNIRENNAGVFASNLGLQHMIGPCTTRQWRIFVRYFVLLWKQQIVWAPSSSSSSSSRNQNNQKNNNHENRQGEEENENDKIEIAEAERRENEMLRRHNEYAKMTTGFDEKEEEEYLNSLTLSALPSSSSSVSNNNNNENENEKLQKYYHQPKFLKNKNEFPKLEQAIWIGPPTIQYARKGMGSERAQLWDVIAWRELKHLGFKRFRTIPVTAARQEATWDGLHYASEKNKVQTVWRNKEARVYRWSGGVANVLFTILLNLICNR